MLIGFQELHQQRERHNHHRHHHQFGGQARNGAFNRGLFALDLIQQGGDFAQLGLHAGRNHHPEAVTMRHCRTRKAHVGAVTDLHVSAQCVGLFLHRFRFAGEVGFVGLQLGDMEPANVGFDEVAGFDTDNIARHQLGGWHRQPVAIAQDLGVVIRHHLQGVQGFLCAFGLPEGEAGINENQQQNRNAFIHCRHTMAGVVAHEEVIAGAGPGQ
ncbi:hypothetical protein LPPLD21_03366 [Lactiplantibacillus paraplantarum]|uniref:Uncharacterized protein n=1 Tax=Lactiplantibacillus paraplantarum TaxID=60520 RepID=A0ABQ0NFE0_9LACO|nr:hypothetical protein LPPLD21_03366 [Lactiplantibacillus paraplantarum]